MTIPASPPHLCVNGAAEAIDFLSEVFGTSERMRVITPDGRIGQAEMAIGDGIVMVADEFPESGLVGPKAIGGTAITLSVYVEDADATFAKAVDAGATALSPVQVFFDGDRSGMFVDPFGHRWNLSTRVEDVSPDEVARRAAERLGLLC